jgi:ABC-type polar amino acid transport system ATPase subunit
VKTENIKIKLIGPEGSGKTIIIRAIEKVLLNAGVIVSTENVFHSIEVAPLTAAQIKKLTK